MLHHGLCLLALLCRCLWFELSGCLLAYIVKSICLCWRYRCSLSLSTSRMTFITASRGWSLSRRTDLLKSVSAAWSVCQIDLLLFVMPGTQFDDESWLSWPLVFLTPTDKISHIEPSLYLTHICMTCCRVVKCLFSPISVYGQWLRRVKYGGRTLLSFLLCTTPSLTLSHAFCSLSFPSPSSLLFFSVLLCTLLATHQLFYCIFCVKMSPII